MRNDEITYVCSWTDEESGRIFGMEGKSNGSGLVFVTCGQDSRDVKSLSLKH